MQLDTRKNCCFGCRRNVISAWGSVLVPLSAISAAVDPPFGAFPGFRAESSHDRPLFMKDQAVEIVGQVGEREFCLRALDANGADEQPEFVLLVGEHMFDLGADCRLGGVGSCHGFGHWLTLGLAPVIVKAEQRLWIHIGTPPWSTELNHEVAQQARVFAGVQLGFSRISADLDIPGRMRV